MNPQPAIDVMRLAAQSMASGDARDVIRAAQQVQDAMDALKSSALAELEVSVGGHEKLPVGGHGIAH